MEIAANFHPIAAKRARDLMGVTAELAGKLDKTGGDVSGVVNFDGAASFRQRDTTGIATSSGGRGAAEVLGRGAGSAAFLQFHRPGEYASYLGLDTDNQWKVGGWSAGPVAHNLLHSGNIGSYNGRVSSSEFSFSDQLFLRSTVDGGVGRIDIRRAQDSNAAYADVFMYKAATDAGTRGNTSSMLRIEQYVGTAQAFQWPFLVKLDVSGSGGGEHCAMYGQAIKRDNNTVWTICTELRDLKPNTTAGMVGWECGMFGRGQDNNGVRVGIDLVYGGGFPYDPGDNEISYGLRVSPLQGQSDWVPGTTNGFETSSSTGRAIMKVGVQLKGNIGTGIDLSEMRNIYSNTAMRLADGLQIKWDNGGYLGFDGTKLIVGMPEGGLSGGSAMPTNTVGYLSVNVGKLGNARIPLLAA